MRDCPRSIHFFTDGETHWIPRQHFTRGQARAFDDSVPYSTQWWEVA